MISFLCVVWLLYHIIAEQCQIGYAQYLCYKEKKKQEGYNKLQWGEIRQKELSNKSDCENSAIDN